MLVKRNNRGGLKDLWDINSLFNRDMFNFDNPVAPMEYKDDGQNFVLSLEMPGLSDDIKVTYDKDVLTVSAEKMEINTDPNYTTRSYGSIQQSYSVPNADPTNIVATYKRGILTVTLGKLNQDAPSPTEITVKCCD